ncbi:hypothetical protein B0A53_04010 [Rhodotorula sp. CCFEE 5036]|nr:hypothetical protein B0A53_04010 [Rhodotorula sp. CCFEE 5036]
MANYARLFALFLAAAPLAAASTPSPAAAAANRLVDFELAHENLYDGLEPIDGLGAPFADDADDLPAPEPADYELVTEQERAGIFERSVDGHEAHKRWNASRARKHKRDWGKAWKGYSTIARAGWSGVSAMQCTLVDDDHIVIYDKAQNNALKGKNGKPAWGAVYRISDESYRALNLETNSFCAGGGWIGNGTLVSVGGNPQQTNLNNGAKNGLAGVRFFTPCSNEKCDVYENPSRIRLTSPRWYPSTVRLVDGSLLIAGGMIAGGYNNAPSTDNPTMEFFPPKGNGLPFYSSFLHDALNSNLFPVLWLLPNGHVFFAANQLAMIYDPVNNVERRIPSLPNGVTVTYPGSSASALLPLTKANSYTPEVLFCGGTTANLDISPSQLSATYPASKQCSRMVLNTAGIAKGWQIEQMPMGRIMSDALITPDAKVIIVNGASQGIAGYGNVRDEIGASNAREPVRQPLLYDPDGVVGRRISKNAPLQKFERLYHSTATVIPDGRIWISGSNPNDDVTTVTYKTRYEVEMLSPPYMSMPRPSFSGQPANILYDKTYSLKISLPKGTKKVQAALLDVGYSTHGVHMSQRWVELDATLNSQTKLTIRGPKTTGLYPPGPAWLVVLADTVPSVMKKVMVGPGSSPPVSESAIRNMLARTSG